MLWAAGGEDVAEWPVSGSISGGDAVLVDEEWNDCEMARLYCCCH